MSARPRQLIVTLAVLAGAGAASGADPVPPPEQAAQYAADVSKSILELQPFRQSHSMAIEGPDARRGTATLIELNPHVNAWLLLTLAWSGTDGRASFHLQNPNRKGQGIRLAPDGLAITTGDHTFACDLWSATPTPLELAGASGLPYAPLCEGLLRLRNPVAGRRTDLERVTDLLRDHVWGGDATVGFVRDHLYRDAYREEGSANAAVRPDPRDETGPAPALLSEASAGRAIVPEHLGIDVIGASSGQLALGGWYEARAVPGVYVSSPRQRLRRDLAGGRPDRRRQRPAEHLLDRCRAGRTAARRRHRRPGQRRRLSLARLRPGP
jgi:hypothetical protein